MGQGDGGDRVLANQHRQAEKRREESIKKIKLADSNGWLPEHEGKYIKPTMVADKFGENKRAEREAALNGRAEKLSAYYVDEEAAKVREENKDKNPRKSRWGRQRDGDEDQPDPFTPEELTQARQRAQSRAKAELMPQFEKEEAERAKMQPKLAERNPGQIREIRNEGYDRRIVAKARQQDAKVGQTNKAVIEAHNRSVDLGNDVNRRIGTPDASSYKGWTGNSVNQAYAYAHSKAEDGAKSAGRHAENANAAARGLQSYAEDQQKRIKEETGYEHQAQQAKNMANIVQHLVKRQQRDIASPPPVPVGNTAPMQQQGLINSVKPMGGEDGVFKQASSDTKLFK